MTTTTATSNTAGIAEEDALRAHLYGFLGALLSGPPGPDLLNRTAALSGDETALGQAIAALATIARETNAIGAEREFNRLFIGVGRGELLPYASYYMTGFLNEKPLAILRRDMAALGIERSPEHREPEDNVAALCEMMAGLITGRFGASVGLSRQREFHNRHLAPWAEHFFTDLEGAKGSLLYAPVGTIGRLFMRIEKDAFRMAGEDAA